MQPKGSVLAQRTVVLQVLRDDRTEWWTRVELERSIERQGVQAALARLEAEGVVVVDGEMIVASRCSRYLDMLGLIGV